MRTRSITYFCVTILLSLILINSCSDSVESDPPKDNNITLTLNPVDAENDSTLSEAAHYIAESSDMIAVGTDEVTRPEGTELSVRTENDGYETVETALTFDRQRVVDIPMTAVDTTDPVDADSVEVTVWADDADTGEELDDLTFRIDGEIISAGVNRVILTEPEDTTIDLTVEQDGYESLTESILFDEDKKVTYELAPEAAGKVTITYDVRNESGEALNNAELFIADTLVATGADGSFELPKSSETVTVCGSADWHEDNCVELTPNKDQPIELVLPRETVSVSVTPDILGYTDRYANAGISWPVFIEEHTIYYLSVGDSTRSGAGRASSSRTEIAEGVTTTIEYPAGPEPIPIELRAEYFPEEGHDYSDNDYLNVAEGATTVPGDADSDIQLNLEHIPACRDGVSNDFTGVMDEDAPGCIDYDASTSHEVGTDGWVYEPDDDVELLQARSTTGLYGGFDETTVISSKAGQREAWTGGRDGYPASMKFGIGSYDLYLKNKKEKDQYNEAFAVKFVCGDSKDTRTDTTGTTQIVPDDPEVDGWTNSPVYGVDASFFSSGLTCSLRSIHANKINGDPPGDGNDDLVFTKPDTSGSNTFVWIFEPEMAAAAEAGKATASFGRQAEGDVQIQDVRTRDPREALRRLDPRRKR